MPTTTILLGDALARLQTLPDSSVNCIVTSPPYYGLRDYGHSGQIGMEFTWQEYVKRLVAVLQECKRVLAKDGVMWLNIGDSYASSKLRGGERFPTKSLLGVPWRVAFALQDIGWTLRQDIIWHKPTPMPESVRDRCTRAHEYVFLLVKDEKYWWDKAALQEPTVTKPQTRTRANGVSAENQKKRIGEGNLTARCGVGETRNKRSVWTVYPTAYLGSHCATMPTTLADLCIRASCPPDGTVLDPFGGAGTTALAANRVGRNATLIELNPEYAELAKTRIQQDLPQCVVTIEP